MSGQNIFLGRWPRKGMFVDRKTMYSEADKVLKRLKVDVNSVYQRVESLSGGRQQSVAIARAISFDPRVVILDEPTANLSVMATERLLETMLELRSTASPRSSSRTACRTSSRSATASWC